MGKSRRDGNVGNYCRNFDDFCPGGNTTLKWTFHREFPNDMCQAMGIFHGEDKISGVLGEFTPLTGGKSQRWLSCVSCHVGGECIVCKERDMDEKMTDKDNKSGYWKCIRRCDECRYWN